MDSIYLNGGFICGCNDSETNHGMGELFTVNKIDMLIEQIEIWGFWPRLYRWYLDNCVYCMFWEIEEYTIINLYSEGNYDRTPTGRVYFEKIDQEEND